MEKCIVIVAADPNGVIGVDNKIPWHYKADFKRFKERTMDGALVMGRKTFESIPEPKTGTMLPGRGIVVVTRAPSRVTSLRPDLITTSVEDGIRGARGGLGHEIWVAGGAEIYRQAFELGLVDEVDFTTVPEVPAEKLGTVVVRFDQAWLKDFELVETVVNAEDDRLKHSIYRRQS